MKSFYEVTIKTLNHEKLINNISDQFPLFNVEKKDYNILKLQVKYSNRKKLNKYLKNNNISILKNRNFGFLFNFLKLFKRYGIIAGIIISCACFFILNNLILNIEIQGNNLISKYEVINYLNNYKLKNKNNILCKNIELKLKEKFSDISLVSVITKGSTLIVNIKENIKNDVVNKTFEPMVACYDGKITDIILSQGTLNVKVGQTVKKGDILVYPYIIDSSGEKRNIQPQASIKAKVWITGELSYKENEISLVKTGKKLSTSFMKINNLFLTTPKKCEYGLYTKQEKVNYLTYNNLLPISYHIVTYYELEEKIINKSFEEDKENLLQQCRQIALQKINEYDIIKNERTQIVQGAGIVNLKVILELEKDITYEN